KLAPAADDRTGADVLGGLDGDEPRQAPRQTLPLRLPLPCDGRERLRPLAASVNFTLRLCHVTAETFQLRQRLLSLEVEDDARARATLRAFVIDEEEEAVARGEQFARRISAAPRLRLSPREALALKLFGGVGRVRARGREQLKEAAARRADEGHAAARRQRVEEAESSALA